MSTAILASGYAFPGYKFSTDNLLESDVNGAGDVLNPDLILPANFLCEKCEPLMMKLEARYSEFRKRGEIRKNIGDPICRAFMPYYSSKDEQRQAVEKGCYICAILLTTKISGILAEDF